LESKCAFKQVGKITNRCREIIDESDVYIDVHKAIRRLAPAPKARVQKGHVVTDPDQPIPEEHLIDLGDEADVDERNEPRTQRLDSFGSRSNAPVVMGSSPKTTFLMRRSSSAADGTVNSPITVRANAYDMREHLKHLGPSNLASRPKSTRYNAVKIKPGIRSATTPDALTAPSNVFEPYKDDPAPKGGEGTGLLKSAGKEASDGVQALQQGYGTYGSLSRSSPPINANGNNESSTVDQNEGATSTSPQRPSARNHDSGESNSDTIGSLPSSRGSVAPRKRNPARSGSITENIVNSGGVQKVVLETNSSSDAEGPGSHDRPASSGNKASRSSLSLSNAGVNSHEVEHDGEGEQVKKKAPNKRRRKRKGGAKSDGAGPSASGNN
jgi:metal transporter CNNM